MGRPETTRSLIALLTLLACTPEEVEPRPYRPDSGPADEPLPGDDHRTPADRTPGDLQASDALPAFWECNPLFYNTRDGCDCGCGIPDPDCEGLGCDASACDAAGCVFCHANGGLDFTCGTTPPPVGWTCFGVYYNDGECDCGCSVADSDCGGGGCATPDCRAADCAYCWGAESAGACSG